MKDLIKHLKTKARDIQKNQDININGELESYQEGYADALEYAANEIQEKLKNHDKVRSPKMPR